MKQNICGLIPVYNNSITISAVTQSLLQQLKFVIIVDDGSDDGTEIIIEQLAHDYPGTVSVIHHPQNRGKGAAVQSGLQQAAKLGYTHAIQVDADGQHDLNDLPAFLQGVTDNPKALLLGAPIFDGDIPAIRKHGRKLTQAMIAMEMGTLNVPDAMCGFRAYPIASICRLGRMDPRMSFDPEVMIRAHWAGIPLLRIPTRVRYLPPEEGGISHFLMVNDNIRHTWIHIRLLLQAPFRLLIKAIKQPDE